MSELIIDVEKLRDNIAMFKRVVKVDKLFYGVKANAEKIVLQTLNECGCGFEIASLNEYKKVIDAGGKNENIICGLPVKPVKMLSELQENPIEYYVFDEICEYKKIAKYAKNSKKVLRLNISDIDNETYNWGVELKNIFDMEKSILEDVDGITFHIARNYQIRKLDKVFDRLETLLPLFKDKPMVINLGGGLRKELLPHMKLKYDLNKFYDNLNDRMDKIREKYEVVFYCEPGRGIIEDACNIVTDIELATVRQDVDTVFVDLNIGVPVGSHPYKISILENEKEIDIYNVERRIANIRGNYIDTKFVDSTCEYNVIFTLQLERKLKYGDKIKMYGMGAYTTSCAKLLHSRSALLARKENG